MRKARSNQESSPVKSVRKLTDAQLKKINLIYKYSEKYQINIQFWPDQLAIYIEKNDVTLTSFGGEIEQVLTAAHDYLRRINKITTNDLYGKAIKNQTGR